MTTRSISRLIGVAREVRAPTLFLGVLLDVVDGVLNGADLLGVLIRNVDFKRLFESQHEFHEAERGRPRGRR